MASNSEVVALAGAVASVAHELKSAYVLIRQVLDHNTTQSIDWGQVASSNAGALDGAGNISGTSYTPAEVSNAIGSLAEFMDFWNNGAVTQGNHGGNFEKLTPPIV